MVKYFLIGLLWAFGANAQTPITGATTRTALQTSIASSFPSNGDGAITASVLRTFLTSFTNSAILWADTTTAAVNSAIQNDVSYFSLSNSGVGWFSDYNQMGNLRVNLRQATDLSALVTGSFRDAFFANHVDGDGTNYTGSGLQRVSYGVRSVATGILSGSTFIQQYKDIVGGSFTCVARINWDDRGCSGIIAEAIQHGSAKTSNEFAAENPVAASEQSVSMAAVDAILRPYKAAVDVSHLAFGVAVENDQGYKASAGVYVSSHAHATDPDRDGAFAVGLNMGGAIATDAGIIMPTSRTGSVGTIIQYIANSWTDFLTDTKTFRWIIDGSVVMTKSATDMSAVLPTSAGGGGLYVCIDTAGVMYRKSSCP